MTLPRLDNVALAVDDLDAAVGFFAEIGLEVQGGTNIEGGRHHRCPRGAES